jgi:hypothetical protein
MEILIVGRSGLNMHAELRTYIDVAMTGIECREYHWLSDSLLLKLIRTFYEFESETVL